MEHSPTQRRVSRALHWVGEVTSRAGVAAMVALIVFLFAILLSAFGFPGHWEEGFSTAAASISLVMLFVIQHTQSRQQVATQLKLDELIKAIPEADDLLVHIETAQDAELIEREQDHIAHHESLRESSTEEME
jgi:low affinity Fe/Cu permease